MRLAIAWTVVTSCDKSRAAALQAFDNDLRPGTDRFRVIASNNDVAWNERGVRRALSGFSRLKDGRCEHSARGAIQQFIFREAPTVGQEQARIPLDQGNLVRAERDLVFGRKHGR